jgi:uncharacterized protein DUF3221
VVRGVRCEVRGVRVAGPFAERLSLVLALAILGASAGCSTSKQEEQVPKGDHDTSAPTSSVPTSAPYIVGTVTAADGERIRVEENPADESGSAKASIRIVPGETTIVRRSGERVKAEDIRAGDRVAVWVRGPVMESYPVQARGEVIVIEAKD